MDRQSRLRSELHGLYDDGDNALHPPLVACESLHCLHPCGVVGAVVGLIFNHGLAPG